MSWFESLKAKISANPLMSSLFSIGLGYVAAKYGPAISSACSYFQK